MLQGILALDALPQLLEGESGIEPKREFACGVFNRIKSHTGTEGLAELCIKSGLKMTDFLEADAAIDADAPSVESFLKQQGLTELPL